MGRARYTEVCLLALLPPPPRLGDLLPPSLPRALTMMATLRLVALSLLLVLPTPVVCNSPPILVSNVDQLVLPEDTRVGAVVFTIEAEDPEGSPVKYGILGTDRLEVDPHTGEVIVAKPLDREVNDTLRFIVTLEDEVPDGRNNIVQIPGTAIISDVNDNAPAFLGAPYELAVREDLPVGTTVFSGIKLEDADQAGDTIEVSCDESQSSGACDIFQVIPSPGVNSSVFWGYLVLQRPLDYTQAQFYQLVLVASDGLHKSSTSVEIKVVDVQNSPPVFLSSLTGVVSEDAEIDSVVLTAQARDGDRGDPRKIIYQLVTNPMDFFVIDQETGELRTAKRLDREALQDTNGVIHVQIRAQEVENGIPLNDPLTTTVAEATVTVRDVNDEPPTFNQREYNVTLPENAPIGTPLPHLEMTVTDSDVGSNSEFTLRLEDVSGAFAVEPDHGIGSTTVSIRVANGSLDYENPNHRKFIILVIAEEVNTSPRLSSTATVTVTIADTNDNAPTFDAPSYTASVLESAVPGTVVTATMAKDRDSGGNGQAGFVYRLQGDGADKFLVNNRTGVITVAPCAEPGTPICLDFETKPVYVLSLNVTDDYGNGQSAVVPLKITLVDANDNAPKFTSDTYQSIIDEGASAFDPPLFVLARDADNTSEVSYSVIGGNAGHLLSVDSHTGEIRVVDKNGLDVTSVHNEKLDLIIQASDGKLTSNCTVIVNVLDVNNNHPVFDGDSYEIIVSEDSPIGTSVVQVHADDADTGQNAEIKYHIQKGGFEAFSIDEETGVVRVASKLDYDHRSIYNIEVIAVDGGTSMLTGTTTVTASVANTNDKLPYFAPPTQQTSITEDTRPGTTIYHLKATDPDIASPDALNFAVAEPITAVDKTGQPVTNVDDFKDFFAVDPTNGNVFVKKPLLRDVAAVVRLTVLVTDITAPTFQQGKGTLVITIVDVNDYPPLFSKPWTVEEPYLKTSIVEELPIGTSVGVFAATDPDSNIQRYQLVPPSGYFDINAHSGEVHTTRRIDYEENQKLNFTVVAFDSGVPQLSSTAEVFVDVININDLDPEFNQTSYEAEIKENSPVGTFVRRVYAEDKDGGEFGKISYSLVGEYSEDFTVDADTGDIFVARSKVLDREAIPELTIRVMASDNAPEDTRRSVTVPVRIRILDTNDNPPILTKDSYRIEVQETVTPLANLLQLQAEDRDEDENAHIVYSIIDGNSAGLFTVDPDTGILHTTGSLIGAPREFSLLVEASDGEHAARAKVNITSLDVNQHEPIFIMPSAPNATIDVPENAGLEDNLLMTVQAKDDDFGENGRITYHFKVNNENVQETEEFTIDSNSGELRTKILLDREVQSKYEVFLDEKSSSGGFFPVGSQDLQIIQSDVAAAESVSTVVSNECFVFQLVLVARDQGSPVWHEKLRLLTINLMDVNDNDPAFPQDSTTQPYTFSMSENNPPIVGVGRVQATDPDEGLNARIFYYIVFSSYPGRFTVERTDGTIYTNGSLDREEQDKYELYIKATNDPDFYPGKDQSLDLGEDPSIAHVVINVLDENDNSPRFERSDYYAGVHAMASVNEQVAQVIASDPDLAGNGSLIYYIAASNLYKFGSNRSSGSIVPSPFNISQTGQLCTSNYVAEYNQDRFILDIIAKEKTPPEREARTRVHVWLYENSQLVRIILQKPSAEVHQQQMDIVAGLSNATKRLVVVDRIGPHIDGHDRRHDWSDLYLHAVEPSNNSIVAVPEVLKTIDSKFDFLKDYYADFAILNVLPFQAAEQEESLDSALAALIALLVVLFVGCVSVTVLCCCFRNWIAAQPTDTRKKDALIKKAILDDLNTTENPLWIEQKLKLYEEQELTMQVFCEAEVSVGLGDHDRRDSADFSQVDNTYATIQHPSRRGSHEVVDDGGNYATLGRTGAGGDHREMYEAALGFQGSTFQVPEQMPSLHDQPQLVAELL